MSTLPGLHLQYVIDCDGKKTAVILPIAEYEELIEDLQDLAVAAERRKEATISHEQLTVELMGDAGTSLLLP